LILIVVSDLRAKCLTQRRIWEAKRKQREHEKWLQTPNGQAWQAEGRETIKRQQEKDEQLRREAEELAALRKWTQYHQSKTMDEISKMGGREFEEFLAHLFFRMGYTDISLTPPNDQGGDLLCRCPNGALIVVQAKRWRGSVGNDAVQELLGAMRHYDRLQGMVVTNSRFTDSARTLAKKDSDVKLCDGLRLAEQIRNFLPPEIPPFSWGEYTRVVKDWQPAHSNRVRIGEPRRSRRRRRF
jgi:restriction endonuclease Mrr